MSRAPTLAASRSACSSRSPTPTPSRTSIPGPIWATRSPSTSTAAWLTRWTSALTPPASGFQRLDQGGGVVGAEEALAVDVEGRGPGGAAGLGGGDVAGDAVAMGAGVELGADPVGVETEVTSHPQHRLPRELRLVRVKGVVVLPEAALGGSALTRFRGQHRQRVLLRDRQVAEAEQQPFADPLPHPAQALLGAEAVGALEVAEHHQLQRCPGHPPDVVQAFQRG